MSSVVSTAASATPSSVACSTADFTVFPTKDVACAVGSTTGIPSNTSDILSKCCKTAPVEHFNGNCGYYCLSIEQSVADLQKCFQEGGVNPSTIFCSGNNTATATSKPSSAGVTGARSSGTPGSTARPSGSAQSSSAAAPAGFVPHGVSKVGLGMLGMIVISAFAGALL